MWKQISLTEAVNRLVSGKSVDIGFYNWQGTLLLLGAQRYMRARKRKEFARKLLRNYHGHDGWWIYE